MVLKLKSSLGLLLMFLKLKPLGIVTLVPKAEVFFRTMTHSAEAELLWDLTHGPKAEVLIRTMTHGPEAEVLFWDHDSWS